MNSEPSVPSPRLLPHELKGVSRRGELPSGSLEPTVEELRTLLLCPLLSVEAQRVGLAVLGLAAPFADIDRIAWPSREFFADRMRTLARASRLSAPAATRGLSELIVEGLVVVDREDDGVLYAIDCDALARLNRWHRSTS